MENKEYLVTTFSDGTPVKIYPVKEQSKTMKQVNTITKSEYPLLFSFLAEYDEEPYHQERDHRRGSSFYVTNIYFIDEDTLAEFKQEYDLTEDLSHLLGYWEANSILWSDDWGEDGEIDCLTRVERKVRMIEEEYFEEVETNKSIAHE